DLKRGAAKSHHFLPDAFLDDLVESDKGTAANKKNLLGVNLNVFLMRMLAAALRRNITGAALQNLQERLLHAFAGDVACDAYVVCLASDLVDLVDVNDPDFSSLHIDRRSAGG